MSEKAVSESSRIGFVGLGVMGAPMAAALSRAGFPLALYDADPKRAPSLSLQGALCCDSPAELASASDIVVTMLPNGGVVSEVVTMDQGLLEGLRPGSLLLDTSSSEPWLTQQTAAILTDAGVRMVDAPVSGAEWGAKAAELVFMVGGGDADVARVRPLLDAMGRRTFHLGALGCGHIMKCINNLITAMNLTATAEGLVIGKRYGLDPAVMTDVLNEATGMSWITRTHIQQRVVSRTFDDPFKLALMFKDVGIALNMARDSGVELPAASLNHKLWQRACDANEAGASVSRFVAWLETMTDTPLTSERDDDARPAR
ncbi:NAD(P)-dependent oxidoreductase [Alloalcanivorax profundimaris]|uniref:NAD(P)-dependent oxidoreductase n=1 Tax=Alloalcanivorax profundimaris TaxID=2735259 RepID=UPI00210917EE|nr:NAD(P)-dependent oxidoreductase [Alloalcanivorax profundimaris]MCQ6261842.1 NAD(P)-dependent oxidoreductase [Alcanivorax sp. MM125-6]